MKLKYKGVNVTNYQIWNRSWRLTLSEWIFSGIFVTLTVLLFFLKKYPFWLVIVKVINGLIVIFGGKFLYVKTSAKELVIAKVLRRKKIQWQNINGYFHADTALILNTTIGKSEYIDLKMLAKGDELPRVIEEKLQNCLRFSCPHCAATLGFEEMKCPFCGKSTINKNEKIVI